MIKLTDKERRALEYLAAMPKGAAAFLVGRQLNDAGFATLVELGLSALRPLLRRSFVTREMGIYNYTITEAGRAALAQGE